ncbi:MAG: helix-turn-helix transcriptional regulator [Firmicutes bacterium]|nr:helix-turn-helix transcriptional regulator [Bacillota bacterium]
MFFEQLKRICALNGTTPTSIVKKLGLSSSNVTSWKNGASPKTDVLEKLAQELNVPVSAFFDSNAPSQQQLQPDEAELLEVYQKLAKSGKRQLMGRAYELLDGQAAPQAEAGTTPPDIDMVAPIMERGLKK